eukprot:TRINITY_DN11183_c0_g1_i2.p1 TRINITY_DN11183_c0_g1~~TRINITY_DN11183_c0_g1_i2.p1  ORF type:complete len:121 (+),score=20.06 TRINITY_DN11183_c0_g1_i2:196-558(+)
MVLRQPHTTKADIWSFGICVAEMILGHPPHSSSRLASIWASTSGTTVHAVTDHIRHKSRGLSKDLGTLMEFCLVADPNQRPNADQILTHDFFIKYPNPREGIEGILRTIFISNNLQLHGI